MIKEQLIARYQLLTKVFVETRGTSHFTVGQRICISQERAACLRAISELNENKDLQFAYPFYQVPQALDLKIRDLEKII